MREKPLPQKDAAVGIENFAIKRFFRLFPLYWLSIPVISSVPHR